MTLIDRLQEEDDYFHPPQDKVQKLEQRYFERMEKHTFFDQCAGVYHRHHFENAA